MSHPLGKLNHRADQDLTCSVLSLPQPVAVRLSQVGVSVVDDILSRLGGLTEWVVTSEGALSADAATKSANSRSSQQAGTAVASVPIGVEAALPVGLAHTVRRAVDSKSVRKLDLGASVLIGNRYGGLDAELRLRGNAVHC